MCNALKHTSHTNTHTHKSKSANFAKVCSPFFKANPILIAHCYLFSQLNTHTHTNTHSAKGRNLKLRRLHSKAQQKHIHTTSLCAKPTGFSFTRQQPEAKDKACYSLTGFSLSLSFCALATSNGKNSETTHIFLLCRHLFQVVVAPATDTNSVRAQCLCTFTFVSLSLSFFLSVFFSTSTR